MSEIYEVKTRIPRYFTQQTFVKSGGHAIIRMAGLKGVIEASKALTVEDLNFILATYSLYTETSSAIEQNIEKPVQSIPVVVFDDDEVSPLLTTTRNPKRKKPNKNNV